MRAGTGRGGRAKGPRGGRAGRGPAVWEGAPRPRGEPGPDAARVPRRPCRAMAETKIIYHMDEEETPYLVKLPVAPERVTLADFKNVLSNRPVHAYKFFFKSMDQDFGSVGRAAWAGALASSRACVHELAPVRAGWAFGSGDVRERPRRRQPCCASTAGVGRVSAPSDPECGKLGVRATDYPLGRPDSSF